VRDRIRTRNSGAGGERVAARNTAVSSLSRRRRFIARIIITERVEQDRGLARQRRGNCRERLSTSDSSIQRRELAVQRPLRVVCSRARAAGVNEYLKVTTANYSSRNVAGRHGECTARSRNRAQGCARALQDEGRPRGRAQWRTLCEERLELARDLKVKSLQASKHTHTRARARAHTRTYHFLSSIIFFSLALPRPFRRLLALHVCAIVKKCD